MASNNGTKPVWLVDSREAVRQFFGIDDAALRDWEASGMPHADGYDLAQIHAWRCGIATAESPRHLARRLEAHKKRIEAGVIRGVLVPRDELPERQRLIATMRTLGKNLQREHGHKGADLYDGILDSFEEQARKVFAPTNAADGDETT